MQPALVSRWALVTGTSTGIGRAVTLRLAREGVRVIAGVRRDTDAQDLTAQAARIGAGDRVTPVILDVTKEQDVERAMERVSEITAEDGLWALVNNAGVVIPGPVEYLSISEWRRQFEVNFFSMAELTRRSLPLLFDSDPAPHLATLAMLASIPCKSSVVSLPGAVK